MNNKKNKKKIEKKENKLFPAFFLSREKRVWVYKNSTTEISLTYLPMTFETHKCNLIFLDPNVGEMQYEIIGVPKIPTSQQLFKFNKNID